MDNPVIISVRGLPPKKDGANSMWCKGTELSRLKALREAAVKAMQGHPPYTTPLSLNIQIYAMSINGDLDNFITGICDGLMAAHRNTPIDLQVWSDLPEIATPPHAIVFVDDSCITKIIAERLQPLDGVLQYEIECTVLPHIIPNGTE